MNCQKCGKELSQEEQICSACGWNSEEPDMENAAAEEVTNAENTAGNKKRRIYPSTSGIVIGVMALIILVMGGYIAVDVWRTVSMKRTAEDTLLSSTSLFDENGLLAARTGETWGFIDKTGKWVVNPQFQKVESFAENGLCAVKLSGGEEGDISMQKGNM